jgi:hypothetical protein
VTSPEEQNLRLDQDESLSPDVCVMVRRRQMGQQEFRLELFRRICTQVMDDFPMFLLALVPPDTMRQVTDAYERTYVAVGWHSSLRVALYESAKLIHEYPKLYRNSQMINKANSVIRKFERNKS